MEKFYIRKTIAGFITVPADPLNHPLLTRLHGNRGDQWITKRLPWESLEYGITLLKHTAHKYGLSMQVCGNWRKRPTVILRELPLGVEPKPIDVFGGFSGRYAAKWGASDLYEEYEPLLRSAIATGKPFDTRWYGVKKEIVWARVSREQTHGPISVEVSQCMDNSRALVDTAFWKAAGGNAYSGSGEEALEKYGLSGAESEAVVDEIIEQTGLAEDPYADDPEELLEDIFSMMEGEPGDNCLAESVTLHWKSGFGRVVEALDDCESKTSKALDDWYAKVEAACKEKLAGIRKEALAHCENCKHFHPPIPEARLCPKDPADCGHPKHAALLSANKYFPFVNGCKFWEQK